MGRDREVKVNLIGDARSLERAFARGRTSGSSFGSGMEKVGHGLTTFVKGAAVAAGSAVALGAIVGTVLVKDMARQQAASVQTNTVIASTGKVAGVTRTHVEALATAIQNKSGMDDQAVQSGENMLLTFTNIRNEAGKGNKIFDQTTGILADMTVAMGSDPQKQAIQLGKALNDPVKGITALQKVGVTFSQSQKDTIASMVKANNVVGAQKVILHELTKEFGGSAAAAGQALPGQLGILKGRLMDLGASILSGAVPALNKLTTGAIAVVTAIQTHMPQIKAAWAQYGAPVFAAMVTAGQHVVEWTRANWPQIKATIKGVIDWIGTNIVPTVRAVVNDMIALWNKFGGKIIAVLKPALQGIRAVIEGVLALIRGDWGKAWDSVKSIISNGIKSVRATLSLSLSVFRSLGSKLGGAIVSGISALPGLLAGVATRALGALTDKLLSFHVSIKTNTYLGVPFPVGMSVGFDGGGGSTSGPTIALPTMSMTGADMTGGLKAKAGSKAKSFLNGNLDKVPDTPKRSATPSFTPHASDTGGVSGGGGGGAASSAADKASAAAEKAKAKLQSLADAASKVRDVVVARLDQAFSKVGDFALKAFDGATSAGLNKLQAKASKAAKAIQDNLDATLKTITTTQSALTPAEKALADLQSGHDQAARSADATSASAALAAAQAVGDPVAIADAQKAVDDAAYNQRVFDLGVQATAERVIADQKAADDTKAAQDKATADQKVIDDKLAKDTLNYQSARDLQRTALENQLADFKASLDRHPAAWKAVHAKIMKLFSDDFGPDFKAAGVNIGDAYIKGLASAFAGVSTTVPAASAAVTKSNKANKKVPHLADGGIVKARRGGMLAVIGEGGQDEAVVPLGKGGFMGGGNTFHIDARGVGADPGAIMRRIAWEVRSAGAGS